MTEKKKSQKYKKSKIEVTIDDCQFLITTCYCSPLPQIPKSSIEHFVIFRKPIVFIYKGSYSTINVVLNNSDTLLQKSY